MSTYKTDQEKFWAGQFGNEYIERNRSEDLLASNIALFSKIFSRTQDVESFIELGANIGLNLLAIRHIMHDLQLSAVEINENAVKALNQIKDVNIFHQSILDFKPEAQRDFTLVKGVLIHISPDKLPEVYQTIYDTSCKYICLAEYYNPTPMEVPYRGHEGKLFKRDFAGEMMDRHQDLLLIDYGFVYHRDNHFPQDDLTWFLLEKTK